MKKTAKIGIALVTVVALPVVLATEWVTHKEVMAATKIDAVKSDIVNVSDDTSIRIPATDNVANEMKIVASF